MSKMRSPRQASFLISLALIFSSALLVSSSSASTPAAPIVSITSVNAQSDKNILSVNGSAIPDPLGSAMITEIGIQLRRLGDGDTSSHPTTTNPFAFPKYTFSEVQNASELDFGTLGIASAAWNVSQFDGNILIQINTANLSIQDHEVILLAKDSNGRTSASAPISFSIPKPPIQTVDANFTCGGKSQV